MTPLHAHLALDPAALTRQLQAWRDAHPQLGILALLPEAEQGQVGVLQTVCRALDLPLLGAIFPALVTPTGFIQSGVWLIGLAPMPPHFLIGHLEGNQPRLSEAVGQACNDLNGEQIPTLFLIFDAMVPNISSLLSQVFRDIHTRVRYAGVNAGSETFQPMPCLFDGEQLIGNGVLGLLLSEQQALVEHGYPVARTIMRATSTTGNRIEFIDGRPAMTVYQEVIQRDFGVTLTPENFYDYAVHYPFGVVLAAEVVVRIPVAYGEDGAIFCVGEVPPDSVLRLIRAPSLEESRCVATLARRLHERDGTPPESLLTFYCAGRRMHLGPQADEELRQLQSATGAGTLYGALSLGEINSLEDIGFPEFHNAALVCL